MTDHPTINGKPVHELAKMYAREFMDGKLSRREFMARSTAMGVTAAGAYSLAGNRAGAGACHEHPAWRHASASNGSKGPQGSKNI